MDRHCHREKVEEKVEGQSQGAVVNSGYAAVENNAQASEMMHHLSVTGSTLVLITKSYTWDEVANLPRAGTIDKNPFLVSKISNGHYTFTGSLFSSQSP